VVTKDVRRKIRSCLCQRGNLDNPSVDQMVIYTGIVVDIGLMEREYRRSGGWVTGGEIAVEDAVEKESVLYTKRG
jgi:hypothetical protein